MTTSTPRKEELIEKRRYWKKHLDAWHGSGLTQIGYCQKHDLSRHCFQYWKRRFLPSEQPFLEQL